MNILVTGGAGFIGSNFVRWLKKNAPEHRVVNVDALTYAGNLENLSDIPQDEGYRFVRADIRDRAKMNEIFFENDITHVVNFAAESHVDRSIVDPELFLSTNVLGTQALLDTAKQQWKLAPEDKYSRAFREGVKFLQVSTDEVYGALGKEGFFTEATPLAPNSPYSAAKASADLVCRAYHETFGMPLNITRCSNNYGPYQFPEKLIPLMIHNCMEGKPLPVYGDGMQIRDWLHVDDHCSALYAVLTRGAAGEVYNIGGNNERANLDIVRLIIRSLGAGDELISYVKDRPGHDRRYAIDNTKITTQLGWSPSYTFEEGIQQTIAWYQNHMEWLEHVLSGAYADYYERMYAPFFQ
ncbi:MAG: dTDP-glucose 4,6-dehydratase [Eubacteriales bacterium]|nr:dTDP-glucose 4,6-dehydratase [Eubacteriales bacterium]